MKRLNGWQRIGIILTIAWIIGGGLWLHGRNVEYAIKPRVDYMHMCGATYDHNDPDRSSRFAKCMDRADAIPFLQSDVEILGATAMQTLALLGLAWFLVYALLWMTRWVKSGFKQSASQP